MTTPYVTLSKPNRAECSPVNQPLQPIGKPSRPSLRAAINAKCKECIYDCLSGAGNWREQVTACTSRTCPLYAVRPLSSADKEGAE